MEIALIVVAVIVGMIVLINNIRSSDKPQTQEFTSSLLIHRNVEVPTEAPTASEQMKAMLSSESAQLIGAYSQWKKQYAKKRSDLYCPSIVEVLSQLRILRGGPAVEYLVRVLNSDNVTSSQEAAELLGLIGDSRAVCPLIKSLVARNLLVREISADALGRIGAPAVSALVESIENGSDKPGCYFNELSEQFENDDFSEVGQALSALRRIKDPAAVEPLIEALNSSSEVVRIEVTKILTYFGDCRAIEPLKDAASRWSAFMRKYALEAVEKLEAKN